MSKKPTRLKILVVGDSACGKTSILSVYSSGNFPKSHEITVFDTTVKSTVVGGTPVYLALWDTAGQEDYDRLRPLCYPDTDVLLLVFSFDNPDSLTNAVTKWYPELDDNCPGVPVILVGNKKDLLQSDSFRKIKPGEKQALVNLKDIKACSDKINAVAYMECSARLDLGVREIFETAARIALKDRKKYRCTVL